MKFYAYALLSLVAIAGLILLLAHEPKRGDAAQLTKVSCWFTASTLSHSASCFNVSVPEDHNAPSKKRITFPLVIFKTNIPNTRPPVLHLGAGGPGAPMYLNDDYVINYLLDTHDGFSLEAGRDFYIIDPRGTGLAKPVLSCDTFVKNLPARLAVNLSVEEEWQLTDIDYLDCIKRFNKQGVDLSHYNSVAISKDIELLRKVLKIEKWTLIGVSYGAVYAQIIAKLFPDSVEALILDSAAFPELKINNRFVERTMAPYQALYNYCNAVEECAAPIPQVRERLWALHDKLNLQPQMLEILHPNKDENLPLLLNGERFVGSLLEGVYGEDIFIDLPKIIVDLENNRFDSLLPYVEDLAAFLFDDSYGDVSAAAHYCYDDKPYIDLAKLKIAAEEIEQIQIRNNAQKSLEWPDLCEQMKIFSSDSVTATALITDIPTLFLHGKFDSITPLADVAEQSKNFTNSHLQSFELAHSILGSNDEIELLVADFLDDFKLEKTP